MPDYVPLWDPNYTETSNAVSRDANLSWDPWGDNSPITAPTPILSTAAPEPAHSDPKKTVRDIVWETTQQVAQDMVPKVEAAVQEMVLKEIAAHPQTPATSPTLGLDDITKPEARAAALRSLRGGIYTSVLVGAVTGVTALGGGVNWFTKDGLIVTLSVVGTAIANSVFTYVSHIKFGPPAPK